MRLSGTIVEQQQGDCRYLAGEDVIVIQWGGSPAHDSGYHAHYFPATMTGLRAAHREMNALR